MFEKTANCRKTKNLSYVENAKHFRMVVVVGRVKCPRDVSNDEQLLHVAAGRALAHTVPGGVAKGSACDPQSWYGAFDSS